MAAARALWGGLLCLLLLGVSHAQAQEATSAGPRTIEVNGQTLNVDQLTDQQLKDVLILLWQNQQQIAAQLAGLQQPAGAAPGAPGTAESEPTLDQLLNPPALQTSDSVQSAVTPGATSFNPDIAVVGDLLLNLGDLPGALGFQRHDANNRHIELAFSQRISPAARAVVKFAWEGSHNELDERPSPTAEARSSGGGLSLVTAQQDGGPAVPSGGEIGLEEGYLQFDHLISDVQIRVGRERVPFMTYNLLDAHELPFADRPLQIARTLGADGMAEDGVRLSYLLPTRSFLDLDLAAYDCRNRVAFDGGVTNRPLYFSRLHGYSSWGDTHHELDYSLGWLDGPFGAEGGHSQVLGLQLHYQDLPTQFDRMYYEGGWLQSRIAQGPVSKTADGYYLHVAKRWDRFRRQQVGLRWDSSQSIFPGLDRDINMISAYYTRHVGTERVRLRAQYGRALVEGAPDADLFLLEATYVLGTHPAHD